MRMLHLPSAQSLRKILWRHDWARFWPIALVLLALPALWPFYREGLTRSFDGGLHLLRLGLLDHYVAQGILLPRWTPSLILGYGYPLYNFYAPGAYYVAEILHLLGLSLYHAFCGAFVIQILAAGFGAFFFARDLFASDQRWGTLGGIRQHSLNLPALVVAVAYLYTPYLLTNVYIRGAIAEAGAQALLPWIFWSMRRLVHAEQPARYLFPVVFTLGALALTHNITLLFLPLILLLFTLLQWFQAGADWQRLLWIGGALLGAMGISAFFWLPLLLERHDLADTAYLISRTVWLPGSVWTWQNFLDPGLHYTHTFARPIKLGIVQLSLALLGFFSVIRWLATRRTLHLSSALNENGSSVTPIETVESAGFHRNPRIEWWFWLLVTIGVGAMMGAWALPLWLSNDILPVAQFTWRLLAILSLPLALFVGGLPLLYSAFFERRISRTDNDPTVPAPQMMADLRSPMTWPRAIQLAVSVATIALIIITQRPQLAWMDVYAAESATTSPAVFAQIEVDKGVISGGHRNSSIQEFRPRWADADLILTGDFAPPATPPTITMERAGDFTLTFHVNAPAATFLRFATFYFPGWVVEIDGLSQPLYPSTNLGLLTVDLPAGDYTVALRWVGTTLQWRAALLSLATLLGLVLVCWRYARQPFLVFMLILLFVLGLWTLFRQPLQALAQVDMQAASSVIRTESLVQSDGLTLQGIRFAEEEQGYLTIYPYWLVQERQSATLAMHWQLFDDQNRLVSAVESYPYYNTIRADSWAPGTLMDDAQRLPLPPSLLPGHYQLRLQLQHDSVAATEPVAVADYQLSSAPAAVVTPQHPVDLRYLEPNGEQIHLVGYTAHADGKLLAAPNRVVPVVRAGQYVRYTLFWQAEGLIEQNYHAFVHLTDHLGEPLVQEDQLPGPLFHAPQLWNRYRAHTDSYLLRIPPDAPSGLYWPGVGIYDFATLDRLPPIDAGSDTDRHLLAPLKVLGIPRGQPNNTVDAQFGDMATLLGYTGIAQGESLQDGPLEGGDELSLTFYWRSDSPVAIDYTRFVQLYDAARGMAGQFDSPPQAGGNPTSTWVTDEVIEDPVTLTIDADVLPGNYGVYVGFYNPADGVRLPVLDSAGESDPAGWINVGTVAIE